MEEEFPEKFKEVLSDESISVALISLEGFPDESLDEVFSKIRDEYGYFDEVQIQPNRRVLLRGIIPEKFHLLCLKIMKDEPVIKVLPIELHYVDSELTKDIDSLITDMDRYQIFVYIKNLVVGKRTTDKIVIVYPDNVKRTFPRESLVDVFNYLCTFSH